MCCFYCELMAKLQQIRVAGKNFADFDIPSDLKLSGGQSLVLMIDVIIFYMLVAWAVEEGEDARPVPQNILAAAHQLGVKPGYLGSLPFPARPHQQQTI